MTIRYNKFLKDCTGGVAVEFGLLLPFILTVILGSIQVYYLVQAKLKTLNAVQSIANIVSQTSELTSSSMNDTCAAARMSIYPLPSSSLAVSVASVTNINSVWAIDWTDTTCGNVTSINNISSISQNVTNSSGKSAIFASATYNVTLPIGFPLSRNLTVSATYLVRPRNGTSIKYKKG
jgi:Flp pilus assembly protein TadG